jgi:TonB family protein
VATLAEPRLIQDRNREFYLFPGPQRDERPRAVGFPVIGAGNRLLLAPGAETGRYLEDDRLYLLDFTTAIGNSITPIAAPFPGGPPREITELPRIRNSAEIIAAITAAYPAGLRERGLGGTVGMHFLVGEAGEVRETRLTQIAAYEELNGAALRVAPVYRFSPARAGDEYVAVWVSHAIDFRP